MVDEAEIEKNKRLAALQRELALQTKKSAIDEMSHAWRWVMASVLTVNSGGLIAAIAAARLDQPWSIVAVVTFYLGVMTALTMGWKQVALIAKILPVHSEAIAFWETASIEGELGDIAKLQEVRDRLLTAGKSKFTAGGLSKMSFALFSIGLLCLAVSHVSGHDTLDQPNSALSE